MGFSWRLNRGQRVVLLVAIGVIAAAVTVGLTHEWNGSPADGGWFGYAPETAVSFGRYDGSSWPIWRDVLAWVAAALLWCGAGLFLLRGDSTVDGAAAATRPAWTRRELGLALGWVAVVAQIALGVGFGRLWWLVAVGTAAVLVLLGRSGVPTEEP